MPELVTRKQIMLFLDTTPKSARTYNLYGKKSTTATYTYDANTTEETYITDDNATVTVNSYNVSIDGNMKCYYGDAIYDFINTLRYNLATGDNAKTHALLVDKYDEVTDGNFRAQEFEATIALESYGGDAGEIPTITFNIGLNGTPTNGTATISSTGEVTFTPVTSL